MTGLTKPAVRRNSLGCMRRKRHRGVQRELGRLTKDEPRFDQELRPFLGRAYNLRALADYETGPGSRVSIESARAAIDMARRFVESITGLLT